MKNLLTWFTLVLICSCKSFDSKAKKDINPEKYAQTITAQELKTHLYIYASNEFEGRDTGSPGQKKAIAYIKKEYQDNNIPGGLPDQSYFQEVPLENQKVSISKINFEGKTYENFKTQVVLETSKSITINDKAFVYANYGIEDEKYSDYKNIEVKDKIVLIRTGEPKMNGLYITTGKNEETKWTNFSEGIERKIKVAMGKGAKAVLIIDPNLFDKYASYYKEMFENNIQGRLTLSKNIENIPVLMVNKTLGDKLTASLSDKTASSVITKPIEISIINNSEVLSENVLAFIKGSEKPEEIIIISSHLDHVGVRNGEIYNGADDDGSGTVALLEIAEAFSKAKKDGYSPKRSILFLHVTGEEKGLLGSQYYSDINPIFPLEQTIANLNIDMIGRTDPKRTTGDRNYIYLIGSDKLSTELHNLSENINKKCCNIELDYKYNDENDPNRFYYRSDHYNFAKNNIPVIFYFNGTHEDYHQPTDTPDKIEYDLLENRAKLIFYTAWELANRDKKIEVDQ